MGYSWKDFYSSVKIMISLCRQNKGRCQWSLTLESARLREHTGVSRCSQGHPRRTQGGWDFCPFLTIIRWEAAPCVLRVPSFSAGRWGMDGSTKGNKHLQAPVNAQRPPPGLMLSWQQLSPPGASVFGSPTSTRSQGSRHSTDHPSPAMDLHLDQWPREYPWE